MGRWDRVIHVSIADPTEAFDVGSHQDQLARRRGVSLYFDNSVVPMIDGSQRHSLDSGSPRPAVTISFPVSGRAHVGRPTIERTVFRNRGMITYDQADQMLAQDGEFTQVLRDAYGLAQMLLRRRLKMGALELETALPVDERGQFITGRREAFRRTSSHKIIQEFMTLTNSTLTRILDQAGIPAVYRNQLAPGGMSQEEAMGEINRLISDPASLDERGIARLRKLIKPAFFHFINFGHFSMKGPYAHFTAPIRRYDANVNWRILLSLLDGSPSPYSPEDLEAIAIDMNRIHIEARGQMVNFQKEQSRGKARTSIAMGDFERVSPKEFGRIIKVAAMEGMLTPGFEEAVYEAMERGTLSDTDYCFLLFMAGETNVISKRIRQRIIEKVRESDKMAKNLLKVGIDTFSNWSGLQFLLSFDKNGKDTMAIASVQVMVGERLVTSPIVLGHITKDPLGQAAKDLVEKLSNPYPSSPTPIPT